MSELTVEKQTKILQSNMFMVQKRAGLIKARMVTGGNTQRVCVLTQPPGGKGRLPLASHRDADTYPPPIST